MSFSNMATTPGLQNYIKPPNQLLPNGDLEIFILELKRFFEFTQQPQETQEIFTKAFLSVELIQKYEEVQSDYSGYEERLRKAFEPRKNLAMDLDAALRYRKGNDSCTEFFNKVEKLVDNVLRHKLTKPALMLFLMQNAMEDMETKKELKLREVKSVDKAKEVISRMEEIQKELSSEQSLASLHENKSYAETVKSPRKTQLYQQNKTPIFSNSRTNEAVNFNMPNKSDWKNGTRRFKLQRCWACGEQGHIRAECPNVKCSQCSKNGHFKYQCWDIRRNSVKTEAYYNGRNYDRNQKQFGSRGQYQSRNQSSDRGPHRRQCNAIYDYEYEEGELIQQDDMQKDCEQLKGEAPVSRELLGAINLV